MRWQIGPYEYFGELALLLKRSHSSSVVTTIPVEVLVLTKPDFALHIEPRCGEAMLTYAERYYADNIHYDGAHTSPFTRPPQIADAELCCRRFERPPRSLRVYAQTTSPRSASRL